MNLCPARWGRPLVSCRALRRIAVVHFPRRIARAAVEGIRCVASGDYMFDADESHATAFGTCDALRLLGNQDSAVRDESLRLRRVRSLLDLHITWPEAS